MITVPREQLEQVLKEVQELKQQLEEAGRLRLNASMCEQRLSAMLADFDEKTPVRPPSRTDMRAAFDASSGFTPNAAPGRRR